MRHRSRHGQVGLFPAALLLIIGSTHASAQTTIPLATATGGVAVYYNDNGSGENPLNQAYLRGQYGETNTNGAELNFDSTPIPGVGVSWYDIFQAVPNQFGMDLIVKASTSDGTNPTPLLEAFDNVDGTIAGRANAGPVTWSIADYKGPAPSGPASPQNAIINSLLRGGTGVDPGHTLDGITNPANTLDGSVTNLTIDVTVDGTGTIFTSEISGELNTDGFIHWYTVATGTSPIGNFGLTGKLFFHGTYTYDSTTDTNPLMDFYAGSATIEAEVICADRFVDIAGSDTSVCLDSGNPCATIQYAVNVACPGDTVNVAAGTYAEPVDIDGIAGLTINGADKTTVIVKPPSTLDWNVGGYGSSRQAGIRIVNSTDIVLQNMTMDFDLVRANFVFGVMGWDSTVTLNNNILQNMSVDDTSGGYYDIGTYFRAPGYSDISRATVTISGNAFIDMGRQGAATHDYIDATISDNSFSKTTDDFGYAIEVGSRSVGSITGNTISGYDTPAASDGSESAGIYIENAFTGTCCGGPGPSVVKNVLVESNEISDSQYGMWIGNGYDTYAGDVDIIVALNDNDFHDNWEGGVLIQDEDKADGSSVTVGGGGNSLSNNGDYGYRIFTQGDGDVSVDLSGETITGHVTGVFVDDTGPAVSLACSRIVGNGSGVESSSSTVTVTSSSIAGNTSVGFDGLGIVVGTAVAEVNWWGTADGPSEGGGSGATGSGDAVTANVDFVPFATLIPRCVAPSQAAGLSLRKVVVRQRKAGRGVWIVKGELDSTGTPTFLADVDADGLLLAIDSSSGEVNSLRFSGADCSVRGGNLRCKDAVTRSILRLSKRSSQSFFRIRASVRHQTFALPTVGETPLNVAVQTATDSLVRQDEIDNCQARGSGLICKELP